MKPYYKLKVDPKYEKVVQGDKCLSWLLFSSKRHLETEKKSKRRKQCQTLHQAEDTQVIPINMLLCGKQQPTSICTWLGGKKWEARGERVKPRGKTVTVGRMGRGRGKPAREAGSTGTKWRSVCWLPHAKKMTLIQKAMNAFRICVQMHTSEIYKTHLFSFYTQLFQEWVMEPAVTANDYNQQSICIISVSDWEGDNLLLVQRNRMLLSLFVLR